MTGLLYAMDIVVGDETLVWSNFHKDSSFSIAFLKSKRDNLFWAVLNKGQVLS